MGTAFREALNIQLRHWFILFVGGLLVRRFGFCAASIDSLSNANLDFVAIAGVIGVSIRGVWVRWRLKAKVKVATEVPAGTSETTVARIVKEQGVLATLKG